MKIRQILFRNINSFYGEHPPIVFADGVLEQTGLFVIAGATGAGKSTLLDIITLALFNRVPRITDGDGRGFSKDKLVAEGLIINQKAALEPKAAAYAEVEYELRGKIFRSRWSIDKNRNGNWNDYEMELAQLPDGTILSSRKRDVPGLNAQQIGLTYEQFIRSMVLAQGAFDRFLKASAGERSRLLEQITGTDIYRKLSQQAHVKNRDYEELLRDKRQEMGTIQLLPDERVAELVLERATTEERIKLIEKDLTLYREEAKRIDEVAKADKELAIIAEKQERLTTRQTDFAPKASQLSQHERVVDLAATIQDIDNQIINRNTALTNQQDANDKINTQQAALDSLTEDVQVLMQQPTLTSQTLERDLSAFQDNVLNLVVQVQTEHDRMYEPQQRIRTLSQAALYPWSKTLSADVNEAIDQIAIRQKAVSVELVQMEDEYPDMTPERLSEAVDQYVRQEKELSGLIEMQEQQQQRMIEGMNLKQITDQKQVYLDNHRPALDHLFNEVTALERQRETLEQQKEKLAREADLDEMRNELVAGDSCPLCGSTEHPYTQGYIRQVGTIEVQLQLNADELRRKKSEHDALNKELIGIEAESKRLTIQRNELRDVFAIKKQQISTVLADLTLDTDLQPTELADRQAMAEAHRKELTRLQQLWQEEEQINKLSSDLLAVQQSTKVIAELRKQKDDLFPGEDVKKRCSQLLEHFNRIQTELTRQQSLLEQATNAHQISDQQVASLLANLEPILVERGLTDIEASRQCLLPAPTLRLIQEEQRALADEALGLLLRLDQETTNRTTALDARKTDTPADTIRQLVKDIEKEQRQKIEGLGTVKNQLKTNEETRKKQGKLLDELTKAEAEAMPWRELNRLIGSAKGDEFSRFAQSLTLSHLIGLANRRLSDLSDRYLLLKPREGQDDLYVIDQYQGGAERTVASLSGGETFTLSLGLALALSDLASQNVQIDSLFIDEGFGTLDPESLDMAIVMLEKLQQETKKTIGIISHRHEIKERISVQIQVGKGNDGNSKISIVEL